MTGQPIRFYNRLTGQVETEQVYGERFLRWAYETRGGRLTVAALARRALFSRWYGWRMSRESSRQRVEPFIAQYGLDDSAWEEPPGGFPDFNAFFYRQLRPGTRPLAGDANTIVLPADGRHLVIPELGRETGFFVKGQHFDLAALLDDPALTRQFAGGTLVLSRLCPVDYHRFHFAVDGTPGPSVMLPGPLESVSPIALRRRLAILWHNRRTRCLIERPGGPPVLQMEIGATCVGSIRQTYTPGESVKRGREKGFFAFGGSACITLFTPGTIRLADDLLTHSAEGLETYAHMGDILGYWQG